VLPKFGIEREVRVCDSCFEQHGSSDGEATSQQGDKEGQGVKEKETPSDLPAEYLASPLSKQPQEPAKVPGGKTEAELKEEEEFQLVLALSKSEAEEKEKVKKKATSEMLAGYGGLGNGVTNGTNGSNGGGSVGGKGGPPVDLGGQDSELEKYLNRDYWERRERQDTGPVTQAKSLVLQQQNMGMVQEQVQGSPPGQDRAETEELDEFTNSLRSQLEIFVNRMKSNSSRGRPIANDSSVQTLFMNVMTMHGKLVRYIQEQEDGRVRYEELQDKLAQVKDARAALDALREEEMDRKRREQEELERQRQLQLASKLEVMRKKKAEYLEYQRQVALQRMADQEREVAKMAEANKANYMQQQQGMYNMYLPYGYPQQGMLPPGQPGMPHMPGMLPPGNGMLPPGSGQPGMPPPGSVQPGMPPHTSGQHGMPPHTSGQPGMPAHSAGQPGMLPPGQGQPGMPPPGQGQPGMPPPGQGQPGMPPPGQVHPGMLPPGQYPGYPYGQPHYQPPDQSGPPANPSDPSIPTTTTQQGTFNMGGMAAALPQQMAYMGQQPPQGQGHQLQGYHDQPQHGAPLQPMMPGPGVAPPPPSQQPQPQPQPVAPAASLIDFD